MSTSAIQPTKIIAITIHTAMKNGRATTRFVSTPRLLESSSAGRSRGAMAMVGSGRYRAVLTDSFVLTRGLAQSDRREASLKA
jgi:hypothetical protein